MISKDLYYSTIDRWWDMPTMPKEWRQVSQWLHGAAMLAETWEQSDELLTLSQVAGYRAIMDSDDDVPTFLRRQAE